MTAKPAGRRHDAYTDYLQRIAAGDTKTSWEAVQVCGRWHCWAMKNEHAHIGHL